MQAGMHAVVAVAVGCRATAGWIHTLIVARAEVPV